MNNNLPPEEEARLLAQAVTEPDALRQLYRHYHPRVFGYVANRVGRNADAEDIVSEVFVRVVKSLDQFQYRGDGSFAAYIFRIARNETARFFRSHHRRSVAIALDELPEIESQHLAPDQMLLRKERYQHLRGLIETLSPRRREVVQLRFYAGLRNQEIAVVLDLDERTVASHLTRALADLRDMTERVNLEEQADE